MGLDSLLKTEMLRQARRATKADLTDVAKKLNAQRKEIVGLKRQLAALTKAVKQLGRAATKASGRALATGAEQGDQKLRFRASGFAALRQKLSLTQAEMSRLVGVSPITILKWEKGAARPRASQLAAISAVRKMGKRAARAQLDKRG
jgi:DNA-binding transcriptional regulator YiaG